MNPRPRQTIPLSSICRLYTDSATTTLPPKPSAEPLPAPANHYTDRCSQVGNLSEDTWGLSMSPSIVARHQRSATIVTSNRDADEWLSVMMDAMLVQSSRGRRGTGARSRTRPDEGPEFNDRTCPERLSAEIGILDRRVGITVFIS